MTAVAERESVSPPDWLTERRAAGAARFEAVGLPTTRHEEWRFTPLGAVATTSWAEAPAASPSAAELAGYLFGHPEWTRLVFVNGRYHAELSQLAPIAGVQVMPIAAAIAAGAPEVERYMAQLAAEAGSPFVARNTASFRDGAFVHLAPNADATTPVHLLFVTTPEAAGAETHPRLLVVADRGARGALVESHVAIGGAGDYFSNVVAEVVMAENSWLEHLRIQREGESAHHIGWTQVAAARDSHYRSFSLAMGGRLARHDLDVVLGGANSEALMYGLYLARGEQLVDNHTAIHHDQPDCRSWEVYKGVLADRARGVFNGKIFVKPEAQKTDAKQTNRALLLSDEASIDTKPQLEIFADDVKCTHGATVGMLDPMPLFYATSRGVPREAAERMLTYAFCCEVADEVHLAPVREALHGLVRERLGQ